MEKQGGKKELEEEEVLESNAFLCDTGIACIK